MYQKRYRVVFQLASLSCPLFIPTRQIKKKLAEMYVCFLIVAIFSSSLIIRCVVVCRLCSPFFFLFFSRE
jgi:hypothetical protein